MTRRLLALALSAVVLHPLGPLAGAWAPGKPCTGHVCLCARHCPTKRSAEKPCHEAARESPGVRAACNHDHAAGLAPVAPAVLPAETPIEVAQAFVTLAVAAARDTARGFRNVDSPPPKLA